MKSCEIKTEFCSGELLARYQGRKDTDPKFYCCGACMVMLRRAGLKARQIG